ncbi:E3 ubiquitin-protein ligase LNX [Geranomyces michiganensis]|nr:E3 ubiquitin-protein ligase LNX [Geranomyces michiganensis]
MVPFADLKTRFCTPVEKQTPKFAYIEALDSDLNCPITLEPLIDPVELVNCGHTCSKPHLEKWLRDGRSRGCPVCRAGVPPAAENVMAYRAVTSRVLLGILDKLKVKCQESSSCDWTGARGDLCQHVAARHEAAQLHLAAQLQLKLLQQHKSDAALVARVAELERLVHDKTNQIKNLNMALRNLGMEMDSNVADLEKRLSQLEARPNAAAAITSRARGNGRVENFLQQV